MDKHMHNKAPEKIVRDFVLSNEERNSAFWKSLIEHWEQKLHKCRLALETCEDEKKAASIRGQIKEIKANIALNREPEIDLAVVEI